MTGKTYYTDILPHYFTAINNLCRKFDIGKEKYNFVLLEDNYRSRGYTLLHRPNNIQDRIKHEANFKTVVHAAISPKVNPQKSV